MEDCFVCSKHKGNLITSGVTIYEDDYLYVGHIDKEGESNYLGHLMIDLKRHIPTMAEMTVEEAQALGVMMMKVSKALKTSEGAEHVYALVSGNSVPHLHMHLIARYPNTPREHWGPMEVYDWIDAPMGDNQKVLHLCERIKKQLQKLET